MKRCNLFQRQLVEDYNYPKENIQTHPQFRVKVRPSDERKEYPIDIAVFSDNDKTDDNLYIIVECKGKNRDDGKTQLQDCSRLSKAKFGVWFNGNEKLFLRKYEKDGEILFEEIPNIPQYKQRIEDIGKFENGKHTQGIRKFASGFISKGTFNENGNLDGENCYLKDKDDLECYGKFEDGNLVNEAQIEEAKLQDIMDGIEATLNEIHTDLQSNIIFVPTKKIIVEKRESIKPLTSYERNQLEDKIIKINDKEVGDGKKPSCGMKTITDCYGNQYFFEVIDDAVDGKKEKKEIIMYARKSPENDEIEPLRWNKCDFEECKKEIKLKLKEDGSVDIEYNNGIDIDNNKIVEEMDKKKNEILYGRRERVEKVHQLNIEGTDSKEKKMVNNNNENINLNTHGIHNNNGEEKSSATDGASSKKTDRVVVQFSLKGNNLDNSSEVGQGI